MAPKSARIPILVIARLDRATHAVIFPLHIRFEWRSRPVTLKQFKPFRVFLFDQINFPLPLPALNGLFTRNRVADVEMFLIPNEPNDTVFRGEARNDPVFVFVDPAIEIGSYARVDRSILLAREDVNES
jgi:hypothetical protein